MAKITVFKIYDGGAPKPAFICTFDVDKGKDAWNLSSVCKPKFEVKQIGDRNQHKLINHSDSHGPFEEVVAVVSGNQTIQMCNDQRFRLVRVAKDISLNVIIEYDYANDPDYDDVEWEK